jgi:hypothetical protein
MTFRFKRLAGIGLALASALTLSACYDDGYGYGGVSVGYGSGGYYGEYGDHWYRGYGPHYGWYDGFYYPGRGYWLYDRGGKRHRWNDHHRRYWEGRREQWRNRDHAGNWRDHRRDGNWRGRDARAGENRGWRGNRGDGGGRQAAPSGEGRGWRGNHGISERSGRVERPAPGPMGHVFDRRRSRDD